MKKPKKETTTKLNDSQKYWLGLVDIRVNAMPFDFIIKTYTVDSLGKEHFDEYKSNEFQVPEDKRKEVALARVEGLSSIRDYIQSNGSKEQKFHLDSSIIGALLYASSLGINTDKYEIKKILSISYNTSQTIPLPIIPEPKVDPLDDFLKRAQEKEIDERLKNLAALYQKPIEDYYKPHHTLLAYLIGLIIVPALIFYIIYLLFG